VILKIRAEWNTQTRNCKQSFHQIQQNRNMCDADFYFCRSPECWYIAEILSNAGTRRSIPLREGVKGKGTALVASISAEMKALVDQLPARRNHRTFLTRGENPTD